ncbi:MAG TPA: UDP-2,4-diacetamido-2,4,6-trideoxy-beta-L-altropyranose hydrolase [Candidatus Ozemobacteraceae bacterium]|nr:UDP-2,4-diacetamido-2,4,6-trideoxy-beta-L-altropyranose hydrolase [Candidatus Ozemobacteraceae bacterium]
MPKLLIRADGGPEIGLGHLMRCRTLALAMRERGWEILLLTTSDPGDIWSDLQRAPLPWEQIDGGTAQGFKTAMAAKMHGADLVLIDQYGFATEDFTALWATGPRLAVIDDLGERVLPVDAVINPNPGAEAAPYAKRGVPLCLCGAPYTLVRPEVGRLAGAPLPDDGHVLVTLGGGDVQEITLEVVSALGDDVCARPIVVCVGPACPVDRLAAWERGRNGRRLVRETAALPELMRGAVLTITGGGTTLWETYCIGRPGLAVAWVENQRRTLGIVEEHRTGIAIDARSGVPIEFVVEAFRTIAGDARLREEMVRRQRKLIDGKGAVRVAEALVSHGKSG